MRAVPVGTDIVLLSPRRKPLSERVLLIILTDVLCVLVDGREQ